MYVASMWHVLLSTTNITAKTCTKTTVLYLTTDDINFAFGTKDIIECASSLCQNSGTCVDDINGYTCECDRNYIGNNCQTGTNNALALYINNFGIFALLTQCILNQSTRLLVPLVSGITSLACCS